MDFVVQLHIFVQLYQDIETKYPKFLAAVVNKVVPSMMTQPVGEAGHWQQLFTNCIQLCQWSSEPDPHQSTWYSG